MSMVDFLPFKVHIITADAYLVGNLLLPRRPNQQGSTVPRLLDVLNNPATFLKNPGEVGSTTTVVMVDGTRHSFYGTAPRDFRRLYLRLDKVLLASDELAPGQAGTGVASGLDGQPADIEIMMRGGLRVVGTVRGGSKAALYPRADHKFIAAIGVRYSSPLSPGQDLNLSFAALNNTAIESAVILADDS